MPVATPIDERLTFFHPVTKAGLDLNDKINYRLIQHDGFGIGDFEHLSVSVPELHGEYWYDTKFSAKVVTIDLRIIAQSFVDLENKKRQLMDYFNPLFVNPRADQIPVIRYRQANGTELQMNCILHETASLPTQQHIGQFNARYIFRFRSIAEPFLYEVPQQQIVYYIGAATGFSVGGTLPPFRLPFHVGAGGIYQRPVLNNNGHAPTPVLIDIEGPCNSPIIANETNGRTIAFENVSAPMTLLAGDHLIIDTDPFRQKVNVNGTPRWEALSQAEFWQIEVGFNQLRFELTGTGPTTRMVVTWARRYLGL